MRTLHIITGLNVGGAERALYALLQGGLHTSGEVEVLSLTDMGKYGPMIAALGIPVHCLGMRLGRPGLGALLKFRRIIRGTDARFFQGWMYHGNLAATCAQVVARGRGRSLWNVRHSLYDISREKKGTQWAIRLSAYLSGRADHILYNSQLARQQHEEFGFRHSRASVIPNGFDMDYWRPDADAGLRIRQMLGIGADEKVVGLVTRFHPMKDIPTFLRALAPLMAEDGSLHCVIAGRDIGPANPALASLITDLPAARVHLLGQIADVREVLNALDLLCLSSAWGEGFPNVLGEAMACQVPCVTTEVGDSRRVVGQTGFIVRPSDPSAMSAAIKSLLAEDRPTRLERGRAARRHIEENFSLHSIVDAYRQLYAGLELDDI